MNQFKTVLAALVVFLVTGIAAKGQDKQAEAQKAEEYRKVVTQRADKIVTTLNISDSEKQTKVREIIADQYVNLNAIHDTRNADTKAAKEKLKDNKEEAQKEVKELEAKADKKLAKLHKKYISKLSKQLSPEQVEKVKDGMTYGVLPITYKGYLQMLPNLTEEQRKQILAYLTEAREHAMDAESSEKKHGWFGKYKGRINNYLSKAGIDMNKASKEWQARLKAEEAEKKKQVQ